MTVLEHVGSIGRFAGDAASRPLESTREHGPLRWAVLDPSRESIPEDLRRRWSEMVEEGDNPFVLYQSPEWFDHPAATGLEGRPYLAFARGEDGEVSAIVPYTLDRGCIPLHIARGFHLPTPPLMMIRVLGGRPMMPDLPGAIDGLVGALLGRFPAAGGFEFSGIGEDSGFLRALERAGSVRRGFVHERREGLERIDLISLPPTFGEFLWKYDSKKRYNLKRQIRQAREHAGGDLILERVEHPDDVPGFLESIAVMGRSGGPQPSPSGEEVGRFRDMAGHGLLLGYVLKAEGRPIACLMGKQHGRTYLIDWTRYDRAFGAFSPGTTLLHLAIEDLIEERSFSMINLGLGGAKSSFRSTNESHPYRCFWLIPQTWACRGVLRLRRMLRDGALATGSILRATRRGGRIGESIPEGRRGETTFDPSFMPG